MSPRPRCFYNIQFCPPCQRFTPQGAKIDNVVKINPEEAEALRLKNILGLDQTEAAKKLGVSQSTFQRILASAYKKVSEALIQGKEIKIIDNKK